MAEHLLDLGQLLAQHRCDDLELLGDVVRVGWAKIVRIAADPIAAFRTP